VSIKKPQSVKWLHYGKDNWRVGLWFLAGTSDFSVIQNGSYLVVVTGSFLGREVAGMRKWLQTSCLVPRPGMCKPVHPLHYILWCLIKHKQNFALLNFFFLYTATKYPCKLQRLIIRRRLQFYIQVKTRYLSEKCVEILKYFLKPGTARQHVKS
jgi:hypothetical protein